LFFFFFLFFLLKKIIEPNNDSPLNTYAAQMWDKPEEYKKQVIKIHNSVAA